LGSIKKANFPMFANNDQPFSETLANVLNN
jgi:hypothetical protein